MKELDELIETMEARVKEFNAYIYDSDTRQRIYGEGRRSEAQFVLEQLKEIKNADNRL